ncbi:DUF1573 domain-containing protein [Novipirellula herctigrandis]
MSLHPSTGIRISIGFACVFMAIGLAVSLGAVTPNKPYGVPDHRRTEYEEKIRLLRMESAAIETAKRNTSPRVSIDETEYDFGYIDPGTNGASHEFVVTNTGEGDLVLSPAGSSCKCTVAKIKDRIVPAGESRKVELIWNVGEDVADHYEQRAHIETNDPTREQIELTIRGKVRSQWAFHSDDLLNLKGYAGQTLETSCVIYSQVFDDFVVLETEPSTGKIQVNVKPIRAIDLVGLHARSGYTIKLTYSAPQTHLESFDETVRVHLFDTATETDHWIEIPFRGKFGKPVVFHGPELDASGLDLGTIELGSKKEWSFVVRFKTDAPPKDAHIKSLEPEGLIASLHPIKRVPNTFRVTIRLAEDAKPTIFRFNKQGYVEIADRQHPDLSDWMPLFGEIIPAP